jgi:hypothetical protein
MATPDRNGGALARVRLTDVPLKIRRRYGGLLLDRALKEMDPLSAVTFAAQLERAVEEPSDTVYWVSAAERDRVLG